jgi:hypothetical protein
VGAVEGVPAGTCGERGLADHHRDCMQAGGEEEGEMAARQKTSLLLPPPPHGVACSRILLVDQYEN